MTTSTDKLVTYVPGVYPTVPDGEKTYITAEFRKIANAVTSIEEILANVASGTSIYLQAALNLSDIALASAARTNLGLGSAAVLPSTTWLLTANNLSDLASVSSARTNLGLGSAALLPSTTWLLPANNLSDLAAVATARTNLGLGSAALLTTAGVLQPSNNLSEVTPATARGNLVAATTAQTEVIAGMIPIVNNFTFIILEKIPYGATLTGFTARLAGGTVTATLAINGTSVTGGVINCTTSQQTVTPSGANVMSIGNALAIVLSANASGGTLSYSVTYTRTLA